MTSGNYEIPSHVFDLQSTDDQTAKHFVRTYVCEKPSTIIFPDRGSVQQRKGGTGGGGSSSTAY